MKDNKMIICQNVCRSIRGNRILNDVNLALERGEAIGFYGPNGSGKSMLFRAISGLLHIDSGTIIVDGKKIGEDIEFPSSLGVVIENVGFWPEYTGFENLKMLASIRNIIDDEDIKESILRVGLDPSDTRVYRKYSLGMKQRLGIAQAIMEHPELIILDEPTSALDFEGIDEIHKLLKEEKERGATILIASHDVDELKAVCDRFFRVTSGGNIKETETIIGRVKEK